MKTDLWMIRESTTIGIYFSYKISRTFSLCYLMSSYTKRKENLPTFLIIQVESASLHPLLPLSKSKQLNERLAKQNDIYKYELQQQFLFICIGIFTWMAAVKFLKTTIICKIGCDVAIECTTLESVHTLVIAIASPFPLPTGFFCSATRIQVFIVRSIAIWSSTYIWS